jgi:hypothetical protein
VKVAAVLAGAVFFVGVAVWWVGPDSDWSDRCPAALSEEGSGGFDVTPSVWPPGTRCSGRAPDGQLLESTYVPWEEWLWSLAAAALAGGAATLVISGFRRLSGRGESLSDDAPTL